MEDLEMKVLTIEGNDYVLIDTLEKEDKKYYYFACEKDPTDIQILKEIEENGEEFYVSLEESELDIALDLFYENYNKKDSN